MDFYRNVTVSGDHHQQEQVISTNPTCSSKLANPLDDLFSAHNTEVDVSLEWLSIFVEDCLSSSGICLPASELPTKNVQNNATATATATTTNTAPKSPKPLEKQTAIPLSLGKKYVPGKARSKRKRAAASSSSSSKKNQINSLTSWTHNINNNNNNNPVYPDTQLFHSDPPLLQQAYWLADSELIFPKKVKANEDEDAKEDEKEEEEEEEDVEANNVVQQQPRRCSHCLAQRTPQWRAGPLGPKTLCNACGVRYKSGRLLPEYRPAKSPTFVSYLHSNSHKKVLEMRMAMALMIPSSLPPK